MAETIKGINVVIGSDITGLSAALSDVNKKSRDIQSELKQVERLLKFDPKNTELLAQKQKLLGDQVAATKEKLDRLKSVQVQINEQFKKGEISEGQYRAFQREIVETESKLKNFEKQLKNTQDRSKEFVDRMGTLSTKFEQMGKSFAPVSAAAGALGAGLVGLAVNAGRVADDLNTMSKVTGLSTDTLQKFKYASDIIDVSMETLTGSLARLTRNMDNARAGNKLVQEAFNQLGVAVTDTNGNLRSNEDVFNDVINALGNVKDETERDAIAMRLFGRSAQDLNPLILGGADALKKLGKEAEDAGLIMSQEALDDINEFNDELDTLKATANITGMQLGATIGKALLPTLKNFGERLKDVLTWVKNLDQGTLRIIVTISGLIAVITPLLLLFAKITTSIKTLIPVITGVKTAFTALNAVMKANPILAVVSAVTLLATIAITVWKNWNKVSTWLANAWETLQYVALQVFSAIAIKVGQFISDVLDVLSKLTKFIPGLSTAFETVKEKVDNFVTAAQTKKIEAYQQRLEKTKKSTEELIDPTKELEESRKNLTNTTQKLSEAEDEWTKKLLEQALQSAKTLDEQTKIRLELLEKEEKEAIKKAEKEGQDLNLVRQYYENERNRIIQEAHQKRAEIEKDWADKIRQQQENALLGQAQTLEEETQIRLQTLEEQRKAEIDQAKKNGVDTTNIEQYYENERNRIIQEAHQKRAEIEKDWADKVRQQQENALLGQAQTLEEETQIRLQALEEQRKAEIDQAKKNGIDITSIEQYYENERNRIIQEAHQKRADYVEQWNQKLQDLENQSKFSRVQSIEEETALRLQILERQKEEDLKIAEKLGIDKQAILKYYALEEQKILDAKDKAYRLSAEKSAEAFIGFVDTIGSGAKTLKEALKEMVIGAISNLQKKILAEAMAAQAIAWAWSLQTFGTSLVHLATVAAKVLPAIGVLEGIKSVVRGLAEGGKVTAPTMAVIGEGRDDEVVLPLNSKIFAELGRNIVANMPQQAATAGPTFHFHIGVLIGDERGYKQLARKVFSYEIAERKRLGIE